MLAAKLNEKMSLSISATPCMRSFQICLETLDIAIRLIYALCFKIILHRGPIISIVTNSRVSLFIPHAYIFVFLLCNKPEVIDLTDKSLMALK
jgi:hypothetical protein